MSLPVRARFLDAETLEHRAVIESVLRTRSIEILDSDEGLSECSAIVFLHHFGEDLSKVLRDLVGPGRGRVLATFLGAGQISREEKWAILRAGASDVLVGAAFSDVADQVCDRLKRWNEIDETVSSPFLRNTLVGASNIWRGVLKKVVEAARYAVAPVLFTGESGTGKELLANSVHELDARPAKKELVTVDCTNIAPELAGSELFGHERGAFTGALAERDGAFALADGGTLFLDEVGELSPPLQAQLLRAVQERKYKRVGGNTWRPTEFRLVCATNRDLAAEVAQGRFRPDLYFRIASWVIHAPPLRERRSDIPALALHFLEHECGTPAPQLDDVVLDYLVRRDYPGNVRELHQLMMRIGYRHVGSGPITIGDIPESDRPADLSDRVWRDEPFENAIRNALAGGAGLKDITQAAADVAIRLAVEDEGGNLQRAARRLRVTDRALQMRKANRRPPGRAGEVQASACKGLQPPKLPH